MPYLAQTGCRKMDLYYHNTGKNNGWFGRRWESFFEIFLTISDLFLSKDVVLCLFKIVKK